MKPTINFDIKQNVVQIYSNKIIQLLGQNLVDLALETNRNIRKFKMYNLIFKLAILGLKSGFFFVIFSNSHLMVGVGQVQLGEMFGLIEQIQKFTQ